MRPHALEAWSSIGPRIARARRLGVFTDFDGTLTPIRRRASAVHLSKRARHALAELVASGQVVGVISGREIDDLRTRVGLDGIWYVGDHGFFLRSPRGGTLRLVRGSERAAVTRATRALRAALRSAPGIAIEPKGAGIAVHYRNAPASSRDMAARAVQHLSAPGSGFRLLAGKSVWEIVPDRLVDKAVALRTILQAERRRHVGGILPIYVGDDVADERVFSTQPGLSIVVGGSRSTAARYRLRSPSEVCRLLEWLIRIRRDGHHEPSAALRAGVTARRATSGKRRTRRG